VCIPILLAPLALLHVLKNSQPAASDLSSSTGIMNTEQLSGLRENDIPV